MEAVPDEEVRKTETIDSLIKELSSISPQTQLQSLTKLRLLSKYDPDARPLITNSGALPILTETLYSPSQPAQDLALATLFNLSISSREDLLSNHGFLDAISHLLRLPTASEQSLQTASATLHSLLLDDAFRPVIGSKRDIVFALIDIIRNANSPPRSIKEALKALFGVSLYPPNRPTMIDLGVVGPLFKLVVKDGRVGIVEDATAVIAQVAGCLESGEAFNKVSGVGVLADLLDKATGASDRARENAVGALLNLIKSGQERVVVEDVKELDMVVLLEGVRDVAENGSFKGKDKANDLLNIIDSKILLF